MDPDLLDDLRHLDDPEPPRFNALLASEAARRAAENRSRRARAIGGAVLAVALVAGLGATVVGSNRTADRTQAAGPPLTTAALLPDVTGDVATPTSALPGATTVATDPAAPAPSTTAGTTPAASTATTAAGGGASAGPVVSSAPAGFAPTTFPSAPPTPRAPDGARPPPEGLGFTLRLDGNQVAAGGSLHGVVRFENTRSTPVTLAPQGCPTWRADLYQDGRLTTGAGPVCSTAGRVEVPPAGVVEVDVQVQPGPRLAPGWYVAFSTIGLEEGGLPLHSNGIFVAVVRP